MIQTRQLISSGTTLVQQLRSAQGMFGRFLSLQYNLGDSFLKSSKDFIPFAPASL